ncbi:hypothetical protein B296_00029692 [Ensete ventricosum]|uniref:Uncharacterized protein n=1 Tax=Ensete ventricosum TaxID=4639 RepID=A0A426YAG1_ENSVE|nr:hypothetical protein B296_00029692 [Ensete ventricosum]
MPVGAVPTRANHARGRLLLPAVALAGDSPDRRAAPCGVAVGSRPLRPGHGRYLRPQASSLKMPAIPADDRACGGCPCKGLWPWSATPIGGLAVASHPGRDENKRW